MVCPASSLPSGVRQLGSGGFVGAFADLEELIVITSGRRTIAPQRSRARGAVHGTGAERTVAASPTWAAPMARAKYVSASVYGNLLGCGSSFAASVHEPRSSA